MKAAVMQIKPVARGITAAEDIDPVLSLDTFQHSGIRRLIG